MVRPAGVADVAGAATVVEISVAGAAPLAVATLTVYDVMALPPFEAGAVQETDAEALPAVAETAVGAPGTVAGATGVTLFDGAEAALLPTALVATTLKV